MNEKRKDAELREEFNSIINNLKEILPCYAEKYHYQVCINYFKAYNVNNNNEFRGRILYKLGKLF